MSDKSATNNTADSLNVSKDTEPNVVNDPRFRAGRKIIQSGKAGENAIQLFATLVEESRTKYGEDAIETSACYYEYGNAIFRAAARSTSADDDDDNAADSKTGDDNGNDEKVSAESKSNTKRSAAAEAAQKRLKMTETGSGTSKTTDSLKVPDDSSCDNEKRKATAISSISHESSESKEETSSNLPVMDEDIALALEMIENAFSIMDQYLHSNEDKKNAPFQSWCQNQIPRILTGIGDLYSFLKRHADAADSYIRAIPYRESLVEQYSSPSEESSEKKSASSLSLDHLKARRLFVEVHVLIAEELLAHPSDLDVIATPRPSVSQDKDVNEMKPILLVKASERIDFATGYYEKARDELQETVFLMGKIASKGIDLGMEKEDVCFLATILMGVGNTLADIEEENEKIKELETASKKQRKT